MLELFKISLKTMLMANVFCHFHGNQKKKEFLEVNMLILFMLYMSFF